MSMAPKKMRAIYFEDERVSSAFQKSIVALLTTIQKDIVSKYLPPENTHRLRHGGKWEHPGLPDAVNGGIEQHSSVNKIQFEDIVNHDLGLIDRFVQKIAQDMERQFTQMMYSTVFTACDQTGNTVDAKAAGSTREAFAEMLEKIQFCADKFGNVRLPEIHAGPEAVSTLKNAFEDASPEFHERMEAIKARKIAEALDREVKRKARFVRYGDKL
jgi:hypothetical protein